MLKLAVFASGSGTNFEKIVEATHRGELAAEIVLLVCDRPSARVVELARKYEIPVFSFYPKDYFGKAQYEMEILKALRSHEVEGIALAGYMRLIGSVLLGAYEGRIVNLHPSLLPSFPGKDAIGQAFKAGVKVTGITIHYVDAGMDTGPIIAQKSIDLLPGEEIESLTNRIHALEHEWYPKVINQIIHKKWEVQTHDSTCTH